MNKNLYRIVFNKARGMLMVVPDIAASGCAVSSPAAGVSQTHQRCVSRLRPLSFSLLLALGCVSLVAQANIVADGSAPGSQQPTILGSANGTPQVNIRTPNAAGVSHNKYRQFDVDQRGAILNNSHQMTQTQLGGMVTANPWLARGEAKIILNEVNSQNSSQLNGMLEVAGQKAQIIIANPAGITCDGCGFINANRATLTTGQVQTANGQITGYEVTRGEIAIQGRGMDSTRQDSTDLIARAVKVNAQIQARELNVTAGQNQVDAAHQVVSAKAADGSERPGFAVDVAQVGGMYARKIHLRGTEAGVGVHNAGVIGVSAGDVIVNADGSIINSGQIQASENVRLASRSSISSSGILAAGVKSDSPGATGDILLESGGKLSISGQNAASGTLTAKATSADFSASQTSAFGVEVAATGGDIHTRNARMQAQRITLGTQGTLHNDGGNLTADRLELTASRLSNQQGVLQQTGEAGLRLDHAAGINNRGGAIVANSKKLSLNAAQLDNQQGRVQASAIEIKTDAQSLNNQSGIIAATHDVTLKSGGLNNNGGLLQAGTTLALDLQGGALSNTSGEIFSGGPLSLTGDLLDNAGGKLTSQQEMKLLGNQFTNDGGLLQGGTDLTIDVQGGAFSNRNGGAVFSHGSLNLAGGDVNNAGGTLASAQAIHLKGSQLNNDGGLLQSGADLAIDVQNGALSNRNSGDKGGILSQGTLTLRSGALDNRAGFIAARNESRINSQALDNQNGTLASDTHLSLTTNALNNQQGLIQAGVNLSTDTRGNTLNNSQGEINAGMNLALLSGALLNSSGRIAGGGDLSLHAYGSPLNNEQGRIAAGGKASLNALGLMNLAGEIQSAGELHISVTGTADNRAGLMRSGQAATVNAAGVLNANTSAQDKGIEGQRVALNAATLDNTDGAVRSSERLAVVGIDKLDNLRGLLSSGGELHVQGNDLALTNTSGTLIARENLSVEAASVTGDGNLLSQNAMTLTLKNAFANVGQVIANGNLTFTLAQGLINEGLIKAGEALNLSASSLTNQASGEISAAKNHLRVETTLTNFGLLDGGLTHLHAATIDNLSTGRLYGDHIALEANTINNAAQNGIAPVIAARDRLDIGVGTLNNTGHGLIYSADYLAIGGTLNAQWQAQGQALAFNNHSSTLESGGDMSLNIDVINNLNDQLKTQVVVVENSAHHEAALKGSPNRFDWDKVDTSSKDKYGVHRAKMPDGTQGKEFYEYDYQRTVTETQVTESDPGKIIAGGNLTINSNQGNNKDSRIVAGGLLGGVIGELNNLATTGTRTITDIGRQIRWYSKKSGGGIGGTKTSQGKSKSDYKPAPIIQTIDLQQMAWQSNAPVSGSGTTIASRDTTGVIARIIDVGKLDLALAQRPVTPPFGQVAEIASGPDSVIRLTPPDIRLPDSALFLLRPTGDVPYLIETDPRFTDRRKWLGSDYMQKQFAMDGDNLLKRLGDGFYEQRLIREQITALTGNRYLQGYDNDEQQFQALMEAGVAFARQYGLAPGVALTPQQMAQLTSDMVWLVKQEVTLPDGAKASVLVPQVYVHVRKGDIDGSGALLAGNHIALDVKRDLTNSGRISGRDVVQITAENLTNSGHLGGNRVSLLARTDINNLGGTMQGGDSLSVVAGRDINSITTTRSDGTNRWLDRPAGIFVENDAGTLALQAFNNINLTGSMVSNSGGNSRTQLTAGNDLNLNTVTTTRHEAGTWGKGNNRTLEQSAETGSQINGNGRVALFAGHDVNARAASVMATDSLTVAAGNDIRLTSGESSYHLTENSRQSTGGMLSRKTITRHDEVRATDAVSSRFDGDSITMQAGNNLRIEGSSVAATHDVALRAGNDLTVTAAQTSRQENHQYREQKTGLSGTGGIGVSYGKNDLKLTDTAATRTSAASTVGSTGGSVSLTAGNNLTVNGSDVLANRDLTLTGREVNILAADNQSRRTHTMEQKSSGLTLALSGTVGSAINQAVTQANAANNQSNGRLAALQGVQAALSGMQAAQSVQLNQEQGGSPGSLVGVNLSWGSQSSKSTQTQTASEAQGSRLTAGNNLTINATGGDIRVQGSGLQAGKEMTLSASRDVLLESALSTQTLTGKNESRGSSYGVGINFGQGANGLSLNASVSRGKGHENGSSTGHTETTLSAGDRLRIVSGRDTVLNGAQAGANRVEVNAGRNLTLSSEQDTDNYDARQTSMSAGGSVSMGGGSAQASLSRDKMHSTYASVKEQTGLFAGKGGFDVTVGEHTQLNGAVIASTATADKNRLDTGTLGFNNIRNHAEYEVQHQSAGISSGGNIGSQFVGNLANSLLAGVNGSDSAASTTRAAVSEGSLIIRNQANQQQDIATLSRDAEHANQTLSPIFDKEKEQNRLREAQLIGEIGSQVADITRMQGEIAAAKAERDPTAIAAARTALAQKGNAAPTEEELKAQIHATAMAPYGTGSDAQRAITAATAAIQGLAGGDIAKAATGGAAPYLAQVIHNLTTDPATGNVSTAANLLAHATVNAALAAARGGNAAAGAAGAATAELVAMIAREAYGRPVSELSETEKQTISTLATLAGGLAAGLTGSTTADAVAGAQAGKVAVENNSLAGDKGRKSVKESAEWWKAQVRDKMGEGPLSATTNAVINALADTGDIAIGSADYAADGAMALTACAIGDSYCNKALSDLEGKHQGVANTIKNLIKSETWAGIADMATKAWEGNQLAAETFGAMAASVLLPGKKIPNVSSEIISESIAFSAKQLDKKFKHAADFGVTTSKKNGDTIAEYQTAIKSHLDNKATFEHGNYLLVPESKVFFNPKTNNVVVVDKSGNYVSGWKLEPNTKQYENFINNGVLR